MILSICSMINCYSQLSLVGTCTDTSIKISGVKLVLLVKMLQCYNNMYVHTSEQ
jgi:hypothetical protein